MRQRPPLPVVPGYMVWYDGRLLHARHLEAAAVAAAQGLRWYAAAGTADALVALVAEGARGRGA